MLQWRSSAAQKVKLKPDIISYNVVFNACAKSGDMEKAAEWISMVQEAGQKLHIINLQGY